MATGASAIELSKRFISECMASGLPLKEAYLFGSYAKGNAHEYSDIDVALVSDIFTLNFIENNHFTSLINYRFPDIEVHHYNTVVFQKDDPFIFEIKKTGIKIY